MQKCELLRTKSFLKYFHGKSSFDAFVKEIVVKLLDSGWFLLLL